MSNKYTKWVVIAVILLLVLLFIGWATGIYNNLVTLEEKVSAQWAQVENVYQRRADLIPNLVATVKGYAEHEQETFTRVIEARAKASSITIDPEKLTPEALQQFEQAQGELSSALSRLLVTVEQYPDLKANQNFLELQAQLEGTENRITVERQKFNDTAREYNTSIRSFPRNIVAGLFGFDRKPYFEAKPGADEAPKVEF
ncbi:MAG: LemA family protein [Bacteroidales bacterium]|nr:LemA family protein [Lentimicrobiaceae bacterium]MDD5695942.1 LemA family protein [Bacteroidales bacterium]